MVITLMFNIYSIKQQGTEDIEEYKAVEVAKVKQNLKNYVDIAYATIDSNYKNSRNQAYLQKYYGHRLRSIIDVAETVLKSKATEVSAGRLSREEAQKQAKVEISKIRYDDGTGYIWINDTSKPFPKMIMHPTISSLDGQVLNDPSFNTALGQGKNLFIAFAEVCEQKGGGFVDYLWPKPLSDGSLIPDVPKLSYVKLFREWNWIFGTGVYVDDAITDGMEKSINDIRQMRYNNGVGYFWINDITKPTPRMVMHPTLPSLDGKVMNAQKFNATLGEYTGIGKGMNLFEAFAEVCERDGGGFVDYLWPKPTETGLTEDQPKMSYVKLYEPLGWIVGSGAYIDNIEKEIVEREEMINAQISSLTYKVLMVSIIIILFTIVVLHYVLDKYLSRVLTAQPSAVTDKKPAAVQEGTQGQLSVGTDEYLKIAQEISKTMIAEQTKLLAFTTTVQAVKTGGTDQGLEVANEVKELANKTHQTVEEIQKLVEAIQKRV